MVRDMFEQGVIQCFQILWACPIVLVAKCGGTMRFCVDHCHLNSATKMDVFPLHRIDDSIDILSQSKFFSTLELRSGYWQVKIAPGSVEKMTFITDSGLFDHSAYVMHFLLPIVDGRSTS